MPTRERRTRRSKYTGPALSLQLQACAERSGVDAMVLANHDGLVVASSPWNEEKCAQVAAHFTHVKAHQFRVDTLRGYGAPRTVSARGFRAGDEHLVVCAIGCPTANTVPELYTAINGIRRILG